VVTFVDVEHYQNGELGRRAACWVRRRKLLRIRWAGAKTTDSEYREIVAVGEPLPPWWSWHSGVVEPEPAFRAKVAFGYCLVRFRLDVSVACWRRDLAHWLGLVVPEGGSICQLLPWCWYRCWRWLHRLVLVLVVEEEEEEEAEEEENNNNNRTSVLRGVTTAGRQSLHDPAPNRSIGLTMAEEFVGHAQTMDVHGRGTAYGESHSMLPASILS
jgi:hypothetical protein